MAFLAARLAAQYATRMAVRAGLSRAGIRAAAARAATAARAGAARGRAGATRAARSGVRFAQRNPMSTGYVAGAVTESAMRGKRKFSSIRKGRIVKRPRKAGPVPSAPSSVVTAKYAVAPRMTKLKKPVKAKEKKIKSVINHYKEFGKFTAQKCLYINHEHIGSRYKFWIGVANGLTKALLAKARIYPTKSYEDPVVGPMTDFRDQLDNRVDTSTHKNQLTLVYTVEDQNGNQTPISDTIDISAVASPNTYRAFAQIAQEVATSLQNRYTAAGGVARWLSHAMIWDTNNIPIAQRVTINNLDDAEIHLYVNSLVKFQNVTASDEGSLDKMSIDANPLTGRIYQARGMMPQIDTELATVGNKSLDRFFQEDNTGTGGLTMCGWNTFDADDVGRISHIPHANEIYGHQTVNTGVINMAPGAMKFHKTSFTLVKTFKELSKLMVNFSTTPAPMDYNFGRHTLFGLKCAHKHGQDTIQLGWNRDTDVGCYIKLSSKIYNLKTNYTNDYGATGTGLVQLSAPSEHLRRIP